MGSRYAGPGGSSGGSTVPTDYFAPTGAVRETFDRILLDGSTATMTSGTLYLQAVKLAVGDVVSNISWLNTQTSSGATHQWFCLLDSNRVALAMTADQTSTAWAANTIKSYAVATVAAGAASSFTATYSGLHYIGMMMTATVTMARLGGTSYAAVGANMTPALSGSADAGLTTPPSFPFTAAAITVNTSVLFYGYV